MQRFIETTGATRDKAIEEALRQLGMDRDDVSVEVLANGRKGFLGIGYAPARVRVTYEVDDPEPVQDFVPVNADSREKPDMPETSDTISESGVKASVEVENMVEASDDKKYELEEKHVSEEKDDLKSEPENTKMPEKLSITTDDVTPRLVKSAPKGYSGEKKSRRERRNREKRSGSSSAPKERNLIPVSEECMRQAESIATGFITGLLEKMGVEGTVSVCPQLECDQLRLEISGPEMGPVIGRRGDTLDAIQYLCTLVLNNTLTEHVRLSIDTENYREKRAESLERLARKMALKVLKNRRAMTLEPMNPYERRIIHSALQDYNGVTTYSTGTDPGRRVVIAPDGGRSRK